MLNGRVVQLACPDCLTADERAEVDARRGASLWEVVPGRRAGRAELARLSAAAWHRGAAAPAAAWLERLDPGAALTGVVIAERPGEDLRTVWVGADESGRPLAAELALAPQDWLALEEVLLPPRARELARRVAASR